MQRWIFSILVDLGGFEPAATWVNLPRWRQHLQLSLPHWAGATLQFVEPEFKACSIYGAVEGNSLMYCLMTLDKMNSYYDAGEKAMRSTHMHGRSPLSANNN